MYARTVKIKASKRIVIISAVRFPPGYYIHRLQGKVLQYVPTNVQSTYCGI
jgi:hypothetical protein